MCRSPRCQALTRSTYCQSHAPQPWNHHGRSSTQRGYGTYWRKLRSQVLARDGGLCQECLRQGRTVAATDVDHVVPKSRGGTDDMSNLQALCRECHRVKTTKERSSRGRRAENSP